MWLANLLVHQQKRAVERQQRRVTQLRMIAALQQTEAKQCLSDLVARPDTLALIFAGGVIKDRLSHSSGSKKMATASFLWRLLGIAR